MLAFDGVTTGLEVSSRDALTSGPAQGAAECGFVAFNHVDMPSMPEPAAPLPCFHSTARRSFLEASNAARFLGHDPANRRALASPTPFGWFDVWAYGEAAGHRRGRKSTARRSLDAPADHGYRNGVTARRICRPRRAPGAVP